MQILCHFVSLLTLENSYFQLLFKFINLSKVMQNLASVCGLGNHG